MIKELMQLISGKTEREIIVQKSRSSKWHSVEKKQLELYPHCVSCKIDTTLEVHHILPFHLFSEFELNMGNLLTLCHQCHFLWGHGRDWKAYEPNVVNMLRHSDLKNVKYCLENRAYSKDNAHAQILAQNLTKGLILWQI